MPRVAQCERLGPQALPVRLRGTDSPGWASLESSTDHSTKVLPLCSPHVTCQHLMVLTIDEYDSAGMAETTLYVMRWWIFYDDEPPANWLGEDRGGEALRAPGGM